MNDENEIPTETFLDASATALQLFGQSFINILDPRNFKLQIYLSDKLNATALAPIKMEFTGNVKVRYLYILIHLHVL